MAELELTRSSGDRRLYELGGVGTLHLEGMFSRSATATAGGRRWQISRRGVFTSAIEATDAAGAVAGEFHGRALRRGGTLRWGERELELRSSSILRERYVLRDGKRELAAIEGKSWGRRPVRIAFDDAAVDAGLLLFAAYVVRVLVEDAASSAGGAAGSG